jgi:hypothetical protein
MKAVFCIIDGDRSAALVERFYQAPEGLIIKL